MKKKYLAVMMGWMIAMSSVSVYAEENSSDRLMGRVLEAGEDYLLITAETMDNMAPGQEENSENAENQAESVTVTITDDTQIYKRSMGMPGGNQSPEKTAGDGTGEMPEESMEKPAGESSDGTGNTAGGSSDETEDTAGNAPESMNSENPVGEAADTQPPEKPSGEAADTQSSEKSSGKSADGANPGMMEGQNGFGDAEEITLAEIQEDDMVMITLNSDGTAASIELQSMGEAGGMGPGNGGMGQSSGVDSYDAVKTIEEDTSLTGEEIVSTGTDENAVLISNGAEADLSDMTISRESSDSTGGDNASFYGVGAAVLAEDGTVSIVDSQITTDAAGGAGVFAYGNGTIYVSDTDIVTSQDTSGGLHAAGGGTLYAWNVTAETGGRSAAAIRSDRGGGLMVIDQGTYISNEADSPAVYCTADISVHDAELTANGSEAVCIEGLNTLRLYDCKLTGNMSDDERNDNTWTVIVYQSMSGDSEVGNGTFQMEGGTLTSGNGGIFYTTNTECTITLKNVEILGAEDSEFFLQCTGNTNSRGWGQSGENGSDCLFTAIQQDMKGDVLWDSISNLQFYMKEGSSLQGAFVKDETYAGAGGDGTCNVFIGEDSSWIVTGDSQITNLNCSGTIIDQEGNTVTVQGTDGTVYVEGDGDYTVTVESYSDTADLSGCTEPDTWEDHAAEKNA